MTVEAADLPLCWSDRPAVSGVRPCQRLEKWVLAWWMARTTSGQSLPEPQPEPPPQ